MKEKLEELIILARDEIGYADKTVDDAMKQLKTMADAPEGHPIYESLAKYAHVHDYCQGRISAFKDVIAMIGESDGKH